MVLVTTRCFSFRTAAPPLNLIPWKKTGSAIGGSRSPGSYNCCVTQVALERPGVVKLALLPPLALYVHIPWCVRKCPYCDFNSHERSGALPEKEYVGKLLEDLESLLPSVWGRRLSSVFIGGGTPSPFSPQSIHAPLLGGRARPPPEPGAGNTPQGQPRPLRGGGPPRR